MINFLFLYINKLNLLAIKQTSFKKCNLCSLDIEYTKYELHLDTHPSKILEFLYLGNYHNAMNKKVI